MISNYLWTRDLGSFHFEEAWGNTFPVLRCLLHLFPAANVKLLQVVVMTRL